MAFTMKDFRFGVEIEALSLTHDRMAAAVCVAIPGSYQVANKVRMTDGRLWNVVHDGSLVGVGGEVVSPILTWDDLDMLQNVVRSLRAAGARVNEKCGIHVHVDGAKLTYRAVANLAKSFVKQEDLLYRALKVHPVRMQYCRGLDAHFVHNLERRPMRSLSDVRAAWYGEGGRDCSPGRYDASRYHGLNLNSLFFRGTVEFRLFNGSLHAGEVKAYVLLCLGMAAKAANAKSGVSKRRETSSATGKYDMRVFLLSLGFIGPEFASTRKHLLKHLSGSSAFRNTKRPSKTSATPAAEPVERPAARWLAYEVPSTACTRIYYDEVSV